MKLHSRKKSNEEHKYDILKEREISVISIIITRWVHEYGNLLYQIWKKKNKNFQLFWQLDETYIKVKRKWYCLYLSIGKDEHTLEIQLRKKRDYLAAYAFMKRLVNTFGEPMPLTIDKAPALFCAFKTLRKQGFYLNTHIAQSDI